MMTSEPTRRILAALLFALGACGGAPVHLHGVEFSPAEPAPALRLADANGGTFDLAAERGHVVFIYFGYTHCPDICPLTLSDWAKARAALGTKGEKARYVFVSVDPERDTPAISAAYAKQFDAAFVGLTAAGADLDAIKQAWGFAVMKEETGSKNGYGVAHPGQTFVVDADGRGREILPPNTRPADIAADLKALLP